MHYALHGIVSLNTQMAILPNTTNSGVSRTTETNYWDGQGENSILRERGRKNEVDNGMPERSTGFTLAFVNVYCNKYKPAHHQLHIFHNVTPFGFDLPCKTSATNKNFLSSNPTENDLCTTIAAFAAPRVCGTTRNAKNTSTGWPAGGGYSQCEVSVVRKLPRGITMVVAHTIVAHLLKAKAGEIAELSPYFPASANCKVQLPNNQSHNGPSLTANSVSTTHFTKG